MPKLKSMDLKIIEKPLVLIAFLRLGVTKSDQESVEKLTEKQEMKNETKNEPWRVHGRSLWPPWGVLEVPLEVLGAPLGVTWGPLGHGRVDREVKAGAQRART
jgi:hypothetical protein